MKAYNAAAVKCALLFLFFFVNLSYGFVFSRPLELSSISIDASQVFLINSITRIAIKDVLVLLKKGFPSASVSLNNPDARVHIAVSKSSGEKKPLPASSSEKGGYPSRQYSQGYEWASSDKKGRVVLALKSPSFQGVSFGLYGLLQEKLGFKFYHPKKTIIPFHKEWPLPVNFQWKAFPSFARKGFHIHTLHPTELTEQLHNPDYPHAADDLREYIDWLARNQQDTVQFYLLRGVDRVRWTRHADGLVLYAHKRGIEAGVEFSLFMIQQQAFQTIKLLRFFPSYKKQTDSTLSWIFRVNWDFVTVDFSMGEYLPDLGELMPGLKTYLIRQVTEKYKTKLMLPTHVIGSQRWCQTGSSGPGGTASNDGYPKTGILI